MYAIVEWGGKQYRVEDNAELLVEKVPVEEGKDFVWDRVLLVSDGSDIKVGTPYVDGASVRVKVKGHEKGKKVIIFKYRRRHKYRLKRGHRQNLTRVVVEAIEV